jgi:hypothetical protein
MHIEYSQCRAGSMRLLLVGSIRRGFHGRSKDLRKNQHLNTLHQPESRENASMLRLAHGRLLGVIAAALGGLLRVILRQLEN